MGLKLLYITNGINGSGGLERVLSVKASMLAEQYGYEVHILVLNGAEQNPFYEFSKQIHFHSVAVTGAPWNYIPAYKKGIQQVVDQIQPDVISVCDDGLKGFFIPKFLKTSAKIIYERHVSKLIEYQHTDPLVKKVMTRCKWSMMSYLGKRFEKFVVLTQGNLKEWPALKNLLVLPNPLSFYPEQSSELKSKIVICVGKISYQKGQDLLEEAWQKVHARYPDWELHLYGKENNAFFDTRNLKNNIHFFPPEKDIRQKYLESSIYVMSSRFEGFGMVLTEAMACGVPCVSFDCDYGPGDIITDSVDGFLAEKENTEALAEKLMLLMRDKMLRVQMGRKAKQNAQRYSAEVIVKQWDELFRSLM